MAQIAASAAKIPTDSPQLVSGKPSARRVRPARRDAGSSRSRLLAVGSERAATRGSGEVIEMDCGITVYPARGERGRWRAVWLEDGQRGQCEAATEEKLTAKLEKVKVRLEADAPRMRLPGAALIAHYLDPDRLPVRKRWSRKHAHTQARLCALYVAPVIAAVACEDIKTARPSPWKP
jgi:hypothetical protein